MRVFLAGALLALAPVADAQNYGAWVMGSPQDGYRTIATTNDSGAILLKMCATSTRNCIWAVSSVVPECENMSRYPGLLNATSGAQSVELVCTVDSNIHSLAIANYELMQQYSEADEQIGIAVPLKDGQFRVMRFDLKGSKAASTALEAWTNSQAARSTSDYNL